MIDYDTILSTTEDKMTLLQWLKKVEAALKDASATTFKVNKKGDATLTFSIVFADGSEIESGEIVLQQGESVQSGAIVNGHLMLTLTNGDVLDCGELLNGNVNINGNFTANSIIENMSGYGFAAEPNLAASKLSLSYVGVVKNGNKLTLAVAGLFSPAAGDTIGDNINIGYFVIPAAVADKLIPLKTNVLGYKEVPLGHSSSDIIKAIFGSFKNSATTIRITLYKLGSSGYNNDSIYAFRHEETYLLSDNLVA